MRIVEERAELISLSVGVGKLAGLTAAHVIEHAGRIAYQSQASGDPQAFIDMLKGKKPTPHLAVLEFGWCAFEVTTDRGISHEAVRQRIASYVQESTRFCNYSKDKFTNEIAVVCSEENRECATGRDLYGKEGYAFHVETCDTCLNHRDWREVMTVAERSYLRMTARKHPPQHARAVLPTCLKTTLAWAANFREWYQVVLPTRAHTSAHPQMVRLMQRYIFPQLADYAPEVFGEWKTVLRGIGVEVP